MTGQEAHEKNKRLNFLESTCYTAHKSIQNDLGTHSLSKHFINTSSNLLLLPFILVNQKLHPCCKVCLIDTVYKISWGPLNQFWSWKSIPNGLVYTWDEIFLDRKRAWIKKEAMLKWFCNVSQYKVDYYSIPTLR